MSDSPPQPQTTTFDQIKMYAVLPPTSEVKSKPARKIFCKKFKFSNSTLSVMVQDFNNAPSVAICRNNKMIVMNEVEWNDFLQLINTLSEEVVNCSDKLDALGFVRAPGMYEDNAELVPVSEKSRAIINQVRNPLATRQAAATAAAQD